MAANGFEIFLVIILLLSLIGLGIWLYFVYTAPAPNSNSGTSTPAPAANNGTTPVPYNANKAVNQKITNVGSTNCINMYGNGGGVYNNSCAKAVDSSATGYYNLTFNGKHQLADVTGTQCIANDSTKPASANVFGWACDPTDTKQQWTYDSTAGTFKNANTKLCLDGTKNQITGTTCNPGSIPGQIWNLY